MSLSLAERFALWKWLDETLTALRKNQLLPEAEAEMVPGQRTPVKFGGRLAAWVTMPKPSQKSAYVKDEAKLLAWARVHYPEKIEYPVEVKVDADLIEWLQEHRPESLHTGERVETAWVDDIRRSLADKGFYITLKGEKLTTVPGIEIPDSDPSVPRVNLESGAGDVIGRAWASGQIDLDDVLSLPVGEVKPDAA